MSLYGGVGAVVLSAVPNYAMFFGTYELTKTSVSALLIKLRLIYHPSAYQFLDNLLLFPLNSLLVRV